MDFKDSIKQISERIEKLKDNLPTEEATKNAFVMPFISALGYDVFNPLEVLPEMTCDIGTKKGEKNRLCNNEGRRTHNAHRMQALAARLEPTR